MSRPSPDAAESPDLAAATYWQNSKRPLQILAFLLPLILAYEVRLALLLRTSEPALINKAHETLLEFFNLFGLSGTGGLYLGGAAIVVVLLVWHLLNHDPWHLEFITIGGMALESLLLTIPLIVTGLIIGAGAAAGSPDLATLGIIDKLAISIGAGLYEELLFRMLMIAVLHTLLVDLAKLPSTTGGTVAVVVSAVAFTVYHPLREAGALSIQRIAFYFLAGLYFGAIYLLRGFGIVAGTHALYDVIVVSTLADSAPE